MHSAPMKKDAGQAGMTALEIIPFFYLERVMNSIVKNMLKLSS
jgi:hypothetical protein